MKKSNLITGILYVLFGVVCLIVALLIETKLEGILWGFAGAGIFPGIMMICKYFYWSSPKNKEQYEERLENDRIEQHDELKTKIRDRAGRYAYGIGLVVICFSILVFSFLGALEVYRQCSHDHTLSQRIFKCFKLSQELSFLIS